MTFEEIMQIAEELEKKREAYKRGELKDDMSPEARKDWTEKCNS